MNSYSYLEAEVEALTVADTVAVREHGVSAMVLRTDLPLLLDAEDRELFASREALAEFVARDCAATLILELLMRGFPNDATTRLIAWEDFVTGLTEVEA